MKNGKLIWRLLLLVYMAVVIFLCFWKFAPDDSIPRTLFGIPTDKFIHAIMFMPFVPLCFMSAPVGLIHRKYENGSTVAARILLTLVVISLLGAAVAWLIEFCQGLTTYRSRDILDFYADLAGLAVGFVLISLHCICSKK